MNKQLLKKSLESFAKSKKDKPQVYQDHWSERKEFVAYYQAYDKERILEMSGDDVYDFISPLWAMLIWGNKQYVVDKIIENNGLKKFRIQLADLIWGNKSIVERWNEFRKSIKGMGPGMTSEVLGKTHPEEFMVWNRRAQTALNYLEVKNLPKHNYQVDGIMYERLCNITKEVAMEMRDYGLEDFSLLAANYFFWDELQVEKNLSQIGTKEDKEKLSKDMLSSKTSHFIHDEIRDKIRDIGLWLGFDADTEQKVADGSVVDATWEASIGNMGRVIYVFEVQSKGSVDSLIVNLLKSLNNPAVQGIVAVSDEKQIEKIKKHSLGVKDLGAKLKCWNYEEVLEVHQNFDLGFQSINNLGLVPSGFKK